MVPVFAVERDHLVVRRGHEHHAVVDHGRRLVNARLARVDHPHRLQPADVAGVDLIERAVAPAVVRAPDHQPVAVVGFEEALCRDGLVVLQDG